MNNLIKEYRDSETQKDWFVNYLRIHNEWDDEKYIKMITLIQDIFSEFKESELFPKDLVYFFSSDVDFIIGIVENSFFFNFVPEEYTKEEYYSLIEIRKKELIDLRDTFFYGEF
nr:hypothetical protein [Flavobacterium sp. ASV13]